MDWDELERRPAQGAPLRLVTPPGRVVPFRSANAATLPRLRGMIRTARRLSQVAPFVCLLAAGEAAFAAAALKVPMEPGRWTLTGDAAFVEHRGVASLELKSPLTGSEAVLEGFVFKNGTIEVDVESTGGLGPAIGFRRRDQYTHESFYVRANPKCAEAWDCTQYAPVVRGTLLWDLFPQHQSPAPLRAAGWNRVKLVVSGRRLRAYVNSILALKVDRLEGDALEGGLIIQGTGFVANLTVTPDAVEGLAPHPAPEAADPRVVRHWLMATPTRIPADKVPGIDDKPASVPAAWRLVTAETGGLVNLSRQFPLPPAPDRGLVWLKATLKSRVKQEKRVAVGWNDELWVFVNGKLAYADKNLYQPAEARKKPDGRCALENGSFVLPLAAGDNEVAVALANANFGWGLMLRLDDVLDVTLPGPPGAGDARLYFDQAHGQTAASSQLAGIGERKGFEVHTSAEPIVPESLRAVRTLFIRSPLVRFTTDEKEAIVGFVRRGGSLLLVIDEDRGQDRLGDTGVNHLIAPFGMKLLPDTEYLHNNGAVARAGEIHRSDLQIPFSGGRAVEGGTPFAFQLDKDGKPAEPFAAWQKVDGGGRVIVMGEAMATLFLGTKEGERLTGVPRDFSKTIYWGKDSDAFMEDVLAWLMKR